MTIVTNTHASRRLTSLHWYMPQADVNTHLAYTYLYCVFAFYHYIYSVTYICVSKFHM